MNRFVTTTVRDEADAAQVTLVASKFGEALAATGHHAGVRVEYTEASPVSAKPTVDVGAN